MSPSIGVGAWARLLIRWFTADPLLRRPGKHWQSPPHLTVTERDRDALAWACGQVLRNDEYLPLAFLPKTSYPGCWPTDFIVAQAINLQSGYFIL